MNMAMLMCETLVLVLKKEEAPISCVGCLVAKKWSDPARDPHEQNPCSGFPVPSKFRQVENDKAGMLFVPFTIWLFLCEKASRRSQDFLSEGPGYSLAPVFFVLFATVWEFVTVFSMVNHSAGQRRSCFVHPTGNAVQVAE